MITDGMKTKELSSLTEKERFLLYDDLANNIFNLNNWIYIIEKMVPDDAVCGKEPHTVNKEKLMNALHKSSQRFSEVSHIIGKRYSDNLDATMKSLNK